MSGLLALPSLAFAQYGATPFRDPATGETYHVEGALEIWNPPPDLKVSSEQFGIVGNTIDAVTDLGVQQTRFKELRIVLRPARKHKFRINYLPMTYEAQSTVHRDFVFNGQRYGLNLPITTELSWKTWLLGYEYDFLYKDRWFAGLVLETKLTNVHVALASPIVSDFVDAKGPIPNVGGIFRGYVTPNISITGELVGIKIPTIRDKYQAHYTDFDLYGTVNFNKYVGAQLGYRRIDVGYLFKEDTGEFKMKGPYFGGVVRY
jgi:hypothetical protein